MNKSMVLSFIGVDHPGLVSTISDVIAQHRGSWEESRLTQLCGKFAGILSISVPETELPNLTKALENLPEKGLHVLLEECGSIKTTNEVCRNLILDIVGNERAGIVHDVTDVLANLGLNVEEMLSNYTDAPMSSEKLFHAKISAASPLNLRLSVIQDKLESIGNDLMIEIVEDN